MRSIASNRFNQVSIKDGGGPSLNKFDKKIGTSSSSTKNSTSSTSSTASYNSHNYAKPSAAKFTEVYDFESTPDFSKDIEKINNVENELASHLSSFQTENINTHDNTGTVVSSESNSLWSNITNLWDDATDAVGDFFSDVGSKVSNSVTSLWSESKKWWSDVEDWWEEDAFPWVKNASKTVWDVYTSVGATVWTGVVSLVEGLLQFGEAIVDFVALAGTAVASIVTGLIDGGQAIYGAITGEEWSSLTKQMWNGTMGFVSNQYVAGWFDSFYENTSWGNYLMNKAYGFDTVRSIGTGIGYIAGVVALTVATFGAGSVVASGGTMTVTAATAATSTTQMAITATAAGIGKGTQNAWVDGADLAEGLISGTLTGIWEGVQFYIGGKIGAAGGWGDKIAGQLLGPNAGATANKIISSLSRIILDGIDGGVEGFIQPLLSSIYKDGYYDNNGEYKTFSEDVNIFERYGEIFDDNGGWTAVWTEATIGSATSLLGEAFDLGKYFKNENAIKTNTTTQLSDFDLQTKMDRYNRLVDIINSPEYIEYMDNVSKGYAQKLRLEFDGIEVEARNLELEINNYINSRQTFVEPDKIEIEGIEPTEELPIITEKLNVTEEIPAITEKLNVTEEIPAITEELNVTEDLNITEELNQNIVKIDVNEKINALADFQDAMFTGRISDQKVVDLMYKTFNDAIDKGNPYALQVIRKVTEIKKGIPDLKFVLSNDTNSCYWNWSEDTLVMGIANINMNDSGTLMHELGHCLFSTVLFEQLPDNWDSIVGRARIISSNNGMAVAACDVLQSTSNANWQTAHSTFMSQLQETYGLSLSEYTQILTGQYKTTLSGINSTDLEIRLKDLGCNDDLIKSLQEGILTLEDLPNKLADMEINNGIRRICDEINRTQFGDHSAISDIIDAVYWGKQKDIYGNRLSVTYQHGAKYYENGPSNLAFNEIIANFTQLKITGNEISLNTLKDIFGEEFYNTLEETFMKMISSY